MSPVERRVKLGISWQGLIINVDLLTKEMLPYYTGKVFFFLTVNLHKIKNMTRPNVGEDVVNTHVYALMMHV